MSANENASEIMSEMKRLKEMLNQQQDTIAKQNKILTSDEYLNRQPVQQAQQQQPDTSKMTPAQQFMHQITQTMDSKFSQVQEYIDAAVGQMSSLVQKATPDSALWSKAQIAEKIVDEYPGTSMDLALELAEKRIADDNIRQAKMEEEAAALQTHNDANNASMGGRYNSSTNAPQGKVERSTNEVMEAMWQKCGMDEAMENQQKEQDIWSLPPDEQGVQVLME